jgi:hypothetical protein
MASVRGLLNIQSLNELTYEKKAPIVLSRCGRSAGRQIVLWLDCAPCGCLHDLGVCEGGLAEGAACVVGGVSGVEPLDVVSFVAALVDFTCSATGRAQGLRPMPGHHAASIPPL